jgi:hypothetical protein
MITEKVKVGDIIGAGNHTYEVTKIYEAEGNTCVNVFVLKNGKRGELYEGQYLKYFDRIVKKAFTNWKDEMSKEE